MMIRALGIKRALQLVGEDAKQLLNFKILNSIIC